MKSFSSMRRDFLRAGSLGTMSAAFPIASFATMDQNGTSTSSSVKSIFDVRAFGAVGDGKALDTAAINRAIEAAAATGGGTVIIPAGSYLSFSIHLKSQV